MTGAQWLADTLRARGVEQVFVLCGNGLDPLLEAWNENGMRIIDVRNEQAAAYMADSWGRLTGKLGVVAVSAGPGHTNALTGLTNAHWDGGPMLLISGCSAGATRGALHFQELDQVEMAAPVCKYARLVTRPEALAQEVHNAITAAISSRPGPAHLTIAIEALKGDLGHVGPLRAFPAEVTPQGEADAEGIRRAAEVIARAERPVLVAGSGAFYARAGQALERFAAQTDLPILSMMWDRCCIDGHWPQYVGVTSSEVNGAFPLLAQADVIITLGARVDYRLGHGRPPTCAAGVKFVRIDADPNEVNRIVPADVALVGNAAAVVDRLRLELPEQRKWTDWLEQMRTARQAFLAKWEDRGREDVCPLPAVRIMRELKPFLERDVTFLLDAGNLGRWAHMFLWDRHPTFWHTCGASGVVGWGIPGAVAAKLARPEHPVLLLTGDGSAGFTLGDIETALRFETPYVAVVGSDAAWGIVAEGFPEDKRAGSVLGEIRFDKVAEALGGRGVYIDEPAKLAPAVEEALALDTVTFVHVPIQLGGIAYWDDRA